MSDVISSEQLQQRLEHLAENAAVYVPYLFFGHYYGHDPRAHPEATELKLADAGQHPVTGAASVVVRLAGQQPLLFLVAGDRIAHDRSCSDPGCAGLWERLDDEAAELDTQDIEDGAMLSAAGDSGMFLGEDDPVQIVVDAADLQRAEDEQNAG